MQTYHHLKLNSVLLITNKSHSKDNTHLLVAFFTVVGICTLKQVSFHILLHRIQEILMVSDIYIQRRKRFLAFISEKTVWSVLHWDTKI